MEAMWTAFNPCIAQIKKEIAQAEKIAESYHKQKLKLERGTLGNPCR